MEDPGTPEAFKGVEPTKTEDIAMAEDMEPDEKKEPAVFQMQIWFQGVGAYDHLHSKRINK